MRGGPRGPRGDGRMAKDAKGTMKRLLSYLGAYKFRLALVIACAVGNTVASVMSSSFIRTLIDDYIGPLLLEAAPVFSGLLMALVRMAVIYIAGMTCGFLSNRLMIAVSQGVIRKIRVEMYEHMQTLPIRYFDTHSHGEIMSHYTNDTGTLRQMIGQALPQVFNSLISIVSVFVAMLTQSLWLTLFVVLFAVAMMMITGRIGGMSGKYFASQQKSLACVNGYIEEMINGQRVVKVFNHEDECVSEFDRRNAELCDNATRANQFANIMGPVNNNLGHILYVLLAIVGAALSLWGVTNVSLAEGVGGTITLGMIASFLTLSRSFVMPISNVTQQIASVIMALAGAERIFTLMDEPSEEDHGYVTLVNAERLSDGTLRESEKRTGLWAWKHPHQDGTVTYTELKGDIVLDQVDFGYVPEKTVLHDVSIYARPGEKIAFVGATGAGKTTITNLINRFYDIDDGKIRYDGININKIRKSDLRRSLGVVLQDVNLFTGTVMENLRYGNLEATDEECIAAAKLAGADSFIRMLPEGYNTVLTGDGSGLSQGQRQLLSIARAAVADPPVMILDEATSSIDTRTEAIVQRGMDALMKGRTVFVIAHRLSTVRNSDAIMVLDHGRIIERGNHEALIAQKGTYYQLYTGAFELE